MSIFIQQIFSCWISNIQRTRICAMMLSANNRSFLYNVSVPNRGA